MEIRKIIEIEAPAEVVFQALIAEDQLIQWFPDIAVLEPKIGGKVRFSFYAKNAENLDRDLLLSKWRNSRVCTQQEIILYMDATRDS